MQRDKKIDIFLLQYDEQVYKSAIQIREILLADLPNIIEQIDIPAKMIAYCYGQKYTDMICTIIPSKKGIKLGFYKGAELPDPDGLLEGTGKIPRYVEIKPGKPVNAVAITQLISKALEAYELRSLS